MHVLTLACAGTQVKETLEQISLGAVSDNELEQFLGSDDDDDLEDLAEDPWDKIDSSEEDDGLEKRQRPSNLGEARGAGPSGGRGDSQAVAAKTKLRGDATAEQPLP